MIFLHMKPKSSGGVLDSEGLVEVVSSMDQVTQKPINYDIRYGVWVVFEGDIEYIKRCFHEYGVKTDDTGKYACLYKRWHLIGLKLEFLLLLLPQDMSPQAALCF